MGLWRKIPDMTGRRYGRLTVIRRLAEGAATKVNWECRCDCGAVRSVLGANLTNGYTQSCGCLARDLRREKSGNLNLSPQHAVNHGQSNAPEYESWRAMFGRCTNPSLPTYKYYGARGISVCERWRDFDAFCADMGPRPSINHSIDRIDNDKGYWPENCRWATPRQQSLNRRNTTVVQYHGRAISLIEALDAAGVNVAPQTVRARIKNGWSIEDAIETPTRKRIVCA